MNDDLKDFKSIVLWEIRELRKDVKDLSNFRWRWAGAMAVLSFVVVSGIEIVHLLH